MSPSPTVPPDPRRTRARMEKLAWFLDSAIRVPGTKLRFGLDSIVGLVPGVGDFIGLLLGAVIVYEGLRIGAPRALVMKMLGNSALDFLGGLVPVLGDLFDFAFRSNQRNAKLLIAHLDRIDTAARASPGRSGVAAFLLVAGLLVATFALILYVWHRMLS